MQPLRQHERATARRGHIFARSSAAMSSCRSSCRVSSPTGSSSSWRSSPAIGCCAAASNSGTAAGTSAIARRGYWASSMGVHHHHQTPWPFFPVLPAAMRVVSFAGISVPLAGILLNHRRVPRSASPALHRIARRHGSARSARLATWVAALSPLAFVFSMIYPSAIFFAASVWAFALVEEGHDLAGGTAAGACRAHATRRRHRDHRADVHRAPNASTRRAGRTDRARPASDSGSCTTSGEPATRCGSSTPRPRGTKWTC